MMGRRADSMSLDRTLVALGLATLVATIAVTTAIGCEGNVLLIRNTVRLSLAWYVVAVGAMLFFSPADWEAKSVRGRVVRWCWTWALVCFLVHLVLAFQFFHHWSHANAFERSRQMSGVGEGIYGAYLFTVLWMADVAYWWLRPLGYASRSYWIDRSLHTFMLFIVLNGTIVFDKGIIRWAGALGGIALAVAWWMARRTRSARQALASSRQDDDSAVEGPDAVTGSGGVTPGRYAFAERNANE
jgi:hypothetical protein